MSNKEIDLTYKLKVLQQELEQEEASHKATRALLADKSKIKVTIEGAKSESMKGTGQQPFLCSPAVCTCCFVYVEVARQLIDLDAPYTVHISHHSSLYFTCDRLQ